MKVSSHEYREVIFNQSGQLQARIDENNKLVLRVAVTEINFGLVHDLTDGLNGVNREACEQAIIDTIEQASLNELLAAHRDEK